MKLLYLDTETTQFVTEELNENIMIQLATVYKVDKEFTFYEDKNKNTLPITSKASATHHITEEDLVDKPNYNKTNTYKKLETSLECENIDYMIAHNMPFDDKVLQLAGLDTSKVKKIDTLKVMKFINDMLYEKGEAFESLALQFLMYELKLYKYRKPFYDKYDIEVKNAHDALFDTIDLIILTNWIIKIYNTTYEEMYQITNEPLELHYVPSGSNRGKRFDELTRNQLEWNRDNSWDADVRYTCEILLED